MNQTEHRIFSGNRLIAVEYRDENDAVLVRYDLVEGTVTNYTAGDADDPRVEVTEMAPEVREHMARLDTMEDRLARVEAVLWPAPPDGDGGTTWDDLPYGAAPPLAVIKDIDDICYRNVSGGWLGSPPSGFPPPASDWHHLWDPVG